MKKIILASAVLFVVFCFGQQPKKTVTTKAKIENKKRIYLIEKSDFKLKDNTLKIQKSFSFKSGEEKNIQVPVFIAVNKKQLDSISIPVLNAIIDIANVKSKYSVKNKFTYMPRDISVFCDDKTYYWTVKIEFTAQNNYGAVKDATAYYEFDSKGEFKSQF